MNEKYTYTGLISLADYKRVLEEKKSLEARTAELEALVRELLAEGEYLSMLNGLVPNDYSEWSALVKKAEKVLVQE